jgi:hypothetical protein
LWISRGKSLYPTSRESTLAMQRIPQVTEQPLLQAL